MDPDALMRGLLDEAGLAHGMRVLDLGCGRGDVTRLAAARVGTEGEVIGVDRDTAALAQARESSGAMPQVRFLEYDLARLPRDLGTVDAVIGRRVLMYLPDAAAVIERCVHMLAPGGRVAFQEHDLSRMPMREGEWPEHDRAYEWIRRTVEHEGACMRMGFALPGLLAGAGLVVKGIRAEAGVLGQGLTHPLHHIVQVMLPRIVAAGVADEATVDPDTLQSRLHAECAARADAVYLTELAFRVWAIKPVASHDAG